MAARDGGSKQPVFKAPGTTIQVMTFDGRLPDKLTLVCPGVGGGAEYNGAAYSPVTGSLYTGQVDWCSFFQMPKPEAPSGSSAPPAAHSQSVLNYSYDDAVWVDYTTQSKGQITAFDGDTGRIRWLYHTDAPVMAGLVPTKGGLVFGADVHGNLYAFDADSGAILKHIDAGGAINNGLISYAVDGTQYVAAGVGGVTLLARGVAGALKVKVLALQGGDVPKVTGFARLPSQQAGEAELFGRVCGPCHGGNGKGRTFPSLTRMTSVGDPEVLKRFLTHVPPPMPVLYPGLLTEDEVEQIAGFLKANVLDQTGSTEGFAKASSGGSPDWQTIYAVMTSPRCMNCHSSADFPRQSDDRYPHVYGVMRGEDNRGVEMKRCAACHGIRNNPETGAPGRIDWYQAPISMSTESSPGVPKTGPQMCADLKDPSKKGGRDLAVLAAFIKFDGFITWAWDPGARANGELRTTPPIDTHDAFVQVINRWIEAGAPCPSE
jgi:mono/diheme cytochrome c family protein